MALAVPAAVLSNSAIIRKANCALSFTRAIPVRLLVLGSKTNGALIVVAVGKSTKVVPLVEYCKRAYLLPVLLSRWSQRMEMFCQPTVLTRNCAPAVLFPVP